MTTMLRYRPNLALGLLIVSICAIRIHAQQNNQAPQAPRDPQAIKAVNTAILALGGRGAIAAISDVTMEGSCATSQALSESSESFTWTTSGKEFRYESHNSSLGEGVIASGHGRPASSENGTATSLSGYIAAARPPYHNPASLLLQESDDPQYGFHYLGQKQLDQGLAVEVQIMKASPVSQLKQTEQRWYMDMSTGLPMQLEYLAPYESNPTLVRIVTVEFGTYGAQNGVVFPREIDITLNTSTKKHCKVTDVKTNTNPQASTFDLLSGGGF